MKLLLTTIAAVLLVGCGPSAYQLNERALLEAAVDGNIEAVKTTLGCWYGCECDGGGFYSCG